MRLTPGLQGFKRTRDCVYFHGPRNEGVEADCRYTEVQGGFMVRPRLPANRPKWTRQ